MNINVYWRSPSNLEDCRSTFRIVIVKGQKWSKLTFELNLSEFETLQEATGRFRRNKIWNFEEYVCLRLIFYLTLMLYSFKLTWNICMKHQARNKNYDYFYPIMEKVIRSHFASQKLVCLHYALKDSIALLRIYNMKALFTIWADSWNKFPTIKINSALL